MPDGLRQLEHEHRQRPRRRERAALDRDDLRQVGVGEAADLERGRCSSGHAGAARRRARAGSRVRARRGRPARPSRGQPAESPARSTRWSAEPSAGTATPGRLELLPEAYRPVPDRQRRPGHRADERSASASGAQRRPGASEPPLAVARPRRTPRRGGRRARRARGRRRPRPAPAAPARAASRRATSSAPRAVRQRARRGDPDPQPGERPGPDADRDAVDVGPAPGRPRPAPARASGSSSAACAGRAPGAGSWRASTASRPSASTADDGRRRRGVEPEDDGHA